MAQKPSSRTPRVQLVHEDAGDERIDACQAEMPRHIRVGTYDFLIEVKGRTEAVADSEFGRCQFFNQKIFVCEHQEPQSLVNTVWHEVIHAVHWVFGLDDGSTEEEFTNLGANGTLIVMRENPELMSWIAKWNGVRS